MAHSNRIEHSVVSFLTSTTKTTLSRYVACLLVELSFFIQSLKSNFPYQLKPSYEFHPKPSEKMTIEVEGPKDQPLEKCDKENEKNPQYVVPYVNEIIEYQRSEEVNSLFI